MANSKSILSLVDRAAALYNELTVEYEKCLKAKDVTDNACNLTHEIIEKCSNALDQIMFHAWDLRIAPTLVTKPTRTGYFPAANNMEGYKSSLGQWGIVDLANIDKQFNDVLIKHQPFTDFQNAWIVQLKELARSKHTGLIPQKKIIEPRTTVSRPGSGSVSWGSGVTFGGGVSVMGVPINPATQLPIPSVHVDVKVEHWVSFLLEGTSLNALIFCKTALEKTRKIIEQFTAELQLS